MISYVNEKNIKIEKNSYLLAYCKKFKILRLYDVLINNLKEDGNSV